MTRYTKSVGILLGLATFGGLALGGAPLATATEDGADSSASSCGLPDQGQIDATDVPFETDAVDCDLVGRPLDLGDVVLAIPEPGSGVAISGDSPTGDNVEATVLTAPDGTLSFSDDGSIAAGAPSSAYNTNGCDSNYLGAIKDWKLGGSWGIKIGDGGQPAAGTQAQTAGALNSAGSTWTNESSPCYAEDRSRAPLVQSLGTTTNEGDFQVVNGSSTCASKDGVSSLDAGNLDGGYVGMACTWSSNGIVTESDIRLNTTDYNFTYTPGSGCTTQYDVQSVITHEVGHVLGLKDKGGAENVYQTMYEASFKCRSLARNLGKSDVRHLRARYPW